MPAAERQQDFDNLRAQVHRKLASQLDIGASPDPLPPEIERISPKVERPIPKVEPGRVEALRAQVRDAFTSKPEPKRPMNPFAGLRGRIRITPSRLLLICVALGAGGFAAFLALQHEPTVAAPLPIIAQPAPQPAPVVHSQILVAKQAFAVGDRLTAAGLQWVDWPQDAIRPEFITIANSPKAIDDMAGALARYAFFPGEPIRKEKLAQAGDGYLSDILDQGLRGVSVTVTADAASGGFVLPDDHVDVVLTYNLDKTSKTILHNVRVLSINGRLADPPPASSGSAPAAPAAPTDPSNPHNVFKDTAIATLALDATQSEMVISAGQEGKLSLVLRSLSDVATADPDGDRAANEAIRMTSPFWAANANGGAGAAPKAR